MKKDNVTRMFEMFKRVANVELPALRENAMLSELNLETVRNQFVGTGRLPENLFNEIQDVTNGKLIYIVWLAKKVVDKIILAEDIYKFKNYLKVFEKYKQHFPLKDINQIKTKEQVDEFKKKAIETMEQISASQAGNQVGDGNNDKLVSVNEIQKLKAVGIEFLGMVDGYQVFEIPKGKLDQETYKAYSTILGRCANRDQGATIEICTIANYDHYSNYVSQNNLYVFFNMNDPKSPYQFFYGKNGQDGQFMDKDDTSLI